MDVRMKTGGWWGGEEGWPVFPPCIPTTGKDDLSDQTI
jgi:hypothetical protein